MARQLDLRVVDFADSGSSIEMNVNGAVVPVTYQVVAPSDESWMVVRIRLIIADGVNWSAVGFGAGVALTNGLLLRKRDLVAPATIWGWTFKQNVHLYGRLDRKSTDDLSDPCTVKVFEIPLPEDIGVLIDENTALQFITQDDLRVLDHLRASVVYGIL